jgi:hypothetical protein
LTPSEKATLRRKILSRAGSCGIEIKNFAKAKLADEFAQVVSDLLRVELAEHRKAVEQRYAVGENDDYQGPCPPGMVWNPALKRCGRTQGFVNLVKEEAQHSEIVMKQPEGRRDTVGHQCPNGWFFDYGMRECIPLDPSNKKGTTTEKAEDEVGASRDLAPSPKGQPAKISKDCPAGTIWDGDLKICKPLDSSKKTKSEEEEAALPPFIQKMLDKKKGKDGKDGKDDKKGKKKKGMPFQKKSKSDEENQEAADAVPSNRVGLTPPPEGKVQHQSDCPSNTAWDSKMKICRPLDSMDKDRPSGASPQSPKSTADDVEGLSPARLIQELDRILSEQGENKEKSRVAAKELPNAAFPPSTISSTRRVLMHHLPDVEDPYDTATVDVGRLRNALARVSKVEGFSDRAVGDAFVHLLYHAKEVVAADKEKKE